MTAEGNSDLPVPDLQTMKELCQPSLNGRCGLTAMISIQAMNFRLKNDMIQQVQNSCQFHGLWGDYANKHLDKFLYVTQSIKVNGVTDDALHLYLFPHSLTHHAIAWFDCLPRNSINTFEQMAKMFFGKYFPPSMVTKLRNEIANFRQRPDESLFEAWERGTFMKRRPKECYDLIENITAHHNDWDTSAQRSESSSSITSSSDTEIAALKAVMAEINKNLMRVLQPPLATLKTYMMREPIKEDLKGITTGSGTAYQGPTIPTTSSFIPLVVERETEATKDIVHPTNNRSTEDVQPSVVLTESPILNSEPVISPIIEPVASTFGPSIKSLLTNKDKLCELTRTPLNEHCSAVLLKKFPKKLGDPRKFLIPCDFPKMAECLALADLNASINLMPLSVWNKLPLPNLSPTCMTLELADRSISCPIGVAEDVFVKLEYSQEVLSFFDVIASGNPTPYYDPIVSTTSLTLTPFENSDFLLEEVDAFIALKDDPTSSEVDQSYELKIYEAKSDKSSIDEPPEVELKDLPPYLEYAFLEGDDKLPVIIVKDLSVEEKTALITVLKSHKRAIAWKLSDIKGIDPEFCTQKILMEEDVEPAVQHQRRVNPKIYDVIKNEVLKLLDAGLIL
nr:reverse transcriptase domain-containing protein [Tanacetum cinerariifolium]